MLSYPPMSLSWSLSQSEVQIFIFDWRSLFLWIHVPCRPLRHPRTWCLNTIWPLLCIIPPFGGREKRKGKEILEWAIPFMSLWATFINATSGGPGNEKQKTKQKTRAQKRRDWSESERGALSFHAFVRARGNANGISEFLKENKKRGIYCARC